MVRQRIFFFGLLFVAPFFFGLLFVALSGWGTLWASEGMNRGHGGQASWGSWVHEWNPTVSRFWIRLCGQKGQEV
jgi:hypothetical protein